MSVMLGIALLPGAAVVRPLDFASDAKTAFVTSASVAGPMGLMAVCGSCTEFSQAWVWQHQFSTNFGCSGAMSCYDCNSWNACHFNAQSKMCWDWHDPCGSGGGGNPPKTEEEETAGAASLEMVERATAIGDMKAIGALIRRHPGSVVINESRGSVQLLNCRGAVIASFPLPSAGGLAGGE